eukprot:gb/GECG01012164.1/.p1 GENE.gb/GECG01012164.1/~~gb/GECG01012164.1/.p1  ORF type:complete len:991 (+),score=129.94 gb/GECG01012164.1/:1-2973(+)
MNVLLARELGTLKPEVVRKYYSQPHYSTLYGFGYRASLSGHDGCVNRIAWNRDGTRLFSGSDDCRVIIWEFPANTDEDIDEDGGMFFMEPVATIETGHSANIFGVKPMPLTNDCQIATGAMDGEVRLHCVEKTHLDDCHGPRRKTFRGVKSSQFDSQLLYSHGGRVKNVETSPLEPDLIFSSGEDGLIKQYDIRDWSNNKAKPLISLRSIRPRRNRSEIENNQNGEESSEIREDQQGRDRQREVSAIDAKYVRINQADPNYIAVACGDPYARVYDRRMLPPTSLSNSDTFDEDRLAYYSASDRERYCLRFAPLHLTPELVAEDGELKSYSSHLGLEHCTCVDFSPDGRSLVAYYHADDIYAFDLHQSEDDYYQTGSHYYGRGSEKDDVENINYNGCNQCERSYRERWSEAEEDWWDTFPHQWTELSQWLRKQAAGDDYSSSIDVPSMLTQKFEATYSSSVSSLKEEADKKFRSAEYQEAEKMYALCLEVAKSGSHDNTKTNLPGISTIAANRGIALLKTSRTNDAFEAALLSRFALTCAPLNWKAAARLALSLMDMGHPQRAVNFCVKWIEWCKTNADNVASLLSKVDGSGKDEGAADLTNTLSTAQDLLSSSRGLANQALERGRKRLREREKKRREQESRGDSRRGSSSQTSSSTEASYSSSSTMSSGVSSTSASISASVPSVSEVVTSQHSHDCEASTTAHEVEERVIPQGNSAHCVAPSTVDTEDHALGDENYSRTSTEERRQCLYGLAGLGRQSSSQGSIQSKEMPGRLCTVPTQQWPGEEFCNTRVGIGGRYKGSCNVQTDIKEVAWWSEQCIEELRQVARESFEIQEDVLMDAGMTDGKRSVFNFFNPGKQGVIVAGSDDGRIFFWDRASALLIGTIKGDTDVVNCIAPNPSLPLLASGGIEDKIRLWGRSPKFPSAARGTRVPAREEGKHIEIDMKHMKEIEKQNAENNVGMPSFGFAGALLGQLFSHSGEDQSLNVVGCGQQ